MRRRLFAAWLSLVVVLLAAGLVLADCIQSTLATIDQVIEDVKTQATFEMIQCEANNHNFTLLDPRTLKEIADRYIESADNIDFHDEEFCEQLDEFDKGMKYVIYCHSGKTREMMRGARYQRVAGGRAAGRGAP
jgi:rhodanese-related sulfurtransferase